MSGAEGSKPTLTFSFFPDTRFDGSDDRVRSVVALDMNVAVELRELGSRGHGIVEPLQKRFRCQGHALVPGDPGHQRFVALATENGIGSSTIDEHFRVEGGIEPVKAKLAARIELPDALGHEDTQTERRVHRDRYRDEIRAPYFVLVERIHTQIDGLGLDASALQKSQWARQTQRLVSQLVARDQEHVGACRMVHETIYD